MDYRHKARLCSSVGEVKKHIDLEVQEFSKFIEDEDLLFSCRLILNELLVNAGDHGNKWDREKCIDYELHICDRQISISVEDEGDGLKEICPYDPSSLESSGRGLKIICELADEICLCDNKVTAILYLNSKP